MRSRPASARRTRRPCASGSKRTRPRSNVHLRGVAPWPGRAAADASHVTKQIPLSQDAALVVALAGTAMPFAHSAEDEAERWLRALRLHGQVGAALQALGVGESPLMTGSADDEDGPGTRPLGVEAVDEVTRRSADFAEARQADTVGTADL